MLSVSDKLESLRKRLQGAREANQKAVEEEQRHSHEVQSSDVNANVNGEAEGASKRRRKRKLSDVNDVVDIGSADEADGENEDDQIRSMKRRVRAVQLREIGEIATPIEEPEEDNDGEYGTATDKPENVDRMVTELQNMDKRRAKYRRRRAFDKGADVNFINEGNRLFNKELSKHFDKFESVRELKENLDKGTA